LRDAQAFAARTLPNVGLVTAVDIGDPGDLHPTNKQEVGRRLALVARAQVYHEPVAYSGPAFKSSHVEGATLRIAFDHVQGLHAPSAAVVKGFAVAGPDRIFHWADATIAGDGVHLSSKRVPQPVAARYDWDGNPQGNLRNEADLPAFPFRTDDWPANP
jgi:sialate O-acetylesterase